jgi:aryl-alcohol dehydrogenase-like predicted oxidoreductase
MDALVRQGKVLYWGTSEWPAHAIREAHKVARAHNLVAPTMEQPQYNLFHRERVELEYAPLYSEYGLGLTIWSPLASGLLTGKYNAGVPQDSRLGHERFAWLRDALLEDPQARRIERARKFTAIAEELGVPPAPLAVAWCLRNPHVSTVMLGATKKEQLVQNLEALELTERFDDATWSRIEAATA